jgi:DNA (cytosine-5)-methyltransferase 1
MKLNKNRVLEAMATKKIKTLHELASLLGITKNQLSVMLSEKFNPIKSNVLKLCEMLEVTPFELTGNEYSNQVLSSDPQVRVNVLELFAGAGGLAIGFEQANLYTQAHVEIDKRCCETLKYNRPDWNVINADVSTIDFKEYKDQVDVVAGGFPCQAFSFAGKKLGFEDTRGTLFFEYARCVKEVEPLLFVAENVRGLISHDNGRTLNTMIDVLSDLGDGLKYDVKFKLLNSVEYGVPQKRERVVIVGVRNGVNFKFPKPDSKVVTLREALKDVPKSEGQQYSPKRKAILEMVPPGGCWRNLPVEVQKEFMGKSFFSGGGRTGMARRISWDEPSLTLTCSPSQKQTERCHPEETRPFTVREYARIQTFPDDWEFQGTISDKYKQIGNAVPVKLGKKIGESILSAVTDYYLNLDNYPETIKCANTKYPIFDSSQD